MSAGSGSSAGVRPGPAPRSRTLAELEHELAAARNAREYRYAAELERKIAALSQGSPANPSTEKASRRKR